LELKLDLHVHSTHSPDSYNSIELIHSRIKEIQFHGYALADHDTMAGIDQALNTSGDLVVVPALEVSARGAHVLVLDPSEEIPEGLRVPEVVDRVHDQGATAILAHPYGLPRSWPNMREIESVRFDAIEVANSAQVPYDYICGLNQKLADRLGLPITGGSDSHVPATIGRSYTIVNSESTDYDDVIKAIKLGRTRVGGSNTKFSEWLEKNLFRRLGLG
jgi:predicted metal-dependent phosphoesterase TrpH